MTQDQVETRQHTVESRSKPVTHPEWRSIWSTGRRLFFYCLLSTVYCLLFSLSTIAAETSSEKLPPGAKLVRVETHPGKIELKSPFDYRQLLLTGTLNTGDRVDVTRMARVEKPCHLVTMSDRGIIRPAADGSGQLGVTVLGRSMVIPVKVTGQNEKYAASFVRDV